MAPELLLDEWYDGIQMRDKQIASLRRLACSMVNDGLHWRAGNGISKPVSERKAIIYNILLRTIDPAGPRPPPTAVSLAFEQLMQEAAPHTKSKTAPTSLAMLAKAIPKMGGLSAAEFETRHLGWQSKSLDIRHKD